MTKLAKDAFALTWSEKEGFNFYMPKLRDDTIVDPQAIFMAGCLLATQNKRATKMIMDLFNARNRSNKKSDRNSKDKSPKVQTRRRPSRRK